MIRSLRGKLLLSHLTGIFIAMALVTFLLLTLGREYFVNALEDSLAAQANFIAQALMPGVTASIPSQDISPAYNALQQRAGNLSVQIEDKEPSDTPELQESNLAYLNQISVELSANIEFRFRIMDNRGVVLVDSEELDEGVNLRTDPAVAAALQGEQHSQVEQVNREDWLFVSIPLLIQGEIAGAIQLGQPMRDIALVLSDLRLRLVLVLLVAAPVSAIAGLILARNISQPLRELTTATGKLRHGDFDYPLDTEGVDEIGQLSRSFAMMRDQLQAEERIRTQFVSDVSHELRTPLTAIKGLAETLRDGAADDPMVRDRFLASVEGETDRLIRLVNDLLILSRADSKVLQLQKRTIDLRTLIQDCLEGFQPHAETKGVKIWSRFPEASLEISADPDRVSQILLNLLDNALKHSPEEGNVSVEAKRLEIQAPISEASGRTPSMPPPGRWVLLSVTDGGEGIPEGDLPHVFDRFYRADQSRSRDRGGSGLGLSIARALVEAHGGHIWLESPAPSKSSTEGARGTTASFVLPAE